MAKQTENKADAEGSGRDKNLNLYERISAVMGDIKRLQKDKAVGSGNYAYKAMSEEKVVTEVRAAMIRHGLVIFPIEQQHMLNDMHREAGKIVSLSTVDVRYKLVNIDKPTEYEVVVGSGTGVDSQDKGVGKAMTYAMKYALLRTFMIPTGADPDDVHNEELEKQQTKVAQAAQAQTAAAAESAPVQYVTAAQREEIMELIKTDVIKPDEFTKTMTALPKLTEEQATRTIAKLKATISGRAGGVPV